MSLVLVVTKTSISADGNTMVVTDSTGNYNVTTNPTGYGNPNETRANLYLKLIVNLVKSTGRNLITVPAYNENTASTWSITISEDGWYEIYMFGCKIYSGATTYGLGEITYDSSSDKFYKSLQAANLNNAVTDAAWWLATEDVEDFTAAVADGQADVYEATANTVQVYRSQLCEAQALKKANCDSCDNCQLKDYEKIRMKIEAAGIEEALGNFSEAQEIVETLENICTTLDCAC